VLNDHVMPGMLVLFITHSNTLFIYTGPYETCGSLFVWHATT